jgi:hypothetical protein
LPFVLYPLHYIFLLKSINPAGRRGKARNTSRDFISLIFKTRLTIGAGMAEIYPAAQATGGQIKKNIPIYP